MQIISDTVDADLHSDCSSENGSRQTLPPRLRLLSVGQFEPSWVSLTLQLDAEGCIEPQFRWVSTANEALRILRNESFDCVLVGELDRITSQFAAPTTSGGMARSFRDGAMDAAPTIAIIRSIRASGCDDPLIVVTPESSDGMWKEACQLDCELLVTPNGWESLALVPLIKRAVGRVELTREKHRLALAHHRRLVRERDEAEHLLQQQRQMVEDLDQIVGTDPLTGTRLSANGCAAGSTVRIDLPDSINEYYHELLRTYVIMGCGSLGGEIAKLAELLTLAGLGPREALELHLARVETLVRGLGRRSTRHVMARADLLALELMMHMGECFQRGVQSTAVDAPADNSP